MLRVDNLAIPLSWKEFFLIKELIAKMHADANDPTISRPAGIGWVAIEDLVLKATSVKGPHQQIPWGSKIDVVKVVYNLRKKLEANMVSRDLIETSSHDYRISTSPENLNFDPPNMASG